MTLLPRSRRIRLALIATAPIAASIAVLGVSSPAWATQTSSQCHTFNVCFYANADYQPTSSILNVNDDQSNWTTIKDPAHVCGGIVTHTWNDCASSVHSRFTANYMCVYQNSDFQGSNLDIFPGENLSNLANNNFNDGISSDKVVSKTTPC